MSTSAKQEGWTNAISLADEDVVKTGADGIRARIQDPVVTAPASRQRSSPARSSASGQATTRRRGRSHG